MRLRQRRAVLPTPDPGFPAPEPEPVFWVSFGVLDEEPLQTYLEGRRALGCETETASDGLSGTYVACASTLAYVQERADGTGERVSVTRNSDAAFSEQDWQWLRSMTDAARPLLPDAPQQAAEGEPQEAMADGSDEDGGAAEAPAGQRAADGDGGACLVRPDAVTAVLGIPLEDEGIGTDDMCRYWSQGYLANPEGRLGTEAAVVFNLNPGYGGTAGSHRDNDDSGCRLADGPRPGSYVRACNNEGFYFWDDENGDIDFVMLGRAADSELPGGARNMEDYMLQLASLMHGS